MAKHARHNQPMNSWFDSNPQQRQNATGGVPALENRMNPPSAKIGEYFPEEIPIENPTQPIATRTGIGQGETTPKAASRNARASAIGPSRFSNIPHIDSSDSAKGQAPRAAHPRPVGLNIPPIDSIEQDIPHPNTPETPRHPNAGAQPAPHSSPAPAQYPPNRMPADAYYAPNAVPMHTPYPINGNPARQACPKPYTPQATRRKKGRRLGCLIPVIAVPVTLFAAIAIFAIAHPSFMQPLFEGAFGIQETAPVAASDAAVVFEDISDVAMTEEAMQAEQREQVHARRLLAQCQGVDIYSPISQDELTGVIMHQASYEWGQVMTTQAPQADMEEYEASGKPLRVNNEQTEGLWVDADIAHLYRETDDTAMDTAADVGGEAGTTVYAPVTGQVIAVESYDLYDETPDIRIHIRPDANPNLDVVLLHQTDPTVQAGDRVEAGITPVSSVRDIAAELTDLQLAYYTHTAGNHSHVQVNDLTNPDYIAKYNLQVD